MSLQVNIHHVLFSYTQPSKDDWVIDVWSEALFHVIKSLKIRQCEMQTHNATLARKQVCL